jgi:hypothetical protein
MRNIKINLPDARIVHLALLILAFSGCREYVRLSPAPEAEVHSEVDQAAISKVAGVNVVVQARAWEGTTAIKDEIVPLKVTIENNSGKMISIRYSDFSLISPTGDHYAALPPYKIEGTVEEPVTVRASPGFINPRFYHRGFLIAPYYLPYYDGFAFYDGPFYYDPFYYDRYYTYWREIELPTPEMLELALPDGALEEGGRLSGFLYFESISRDVRKVTFKMNVTDLKTGEILGQISIPFEVRQPNI